MVQVDVFWTYGLNAGLALAAGRALKKEKSFWNNRFFTISLLWTACIFAPSGIYLLWNFPWWETMFLARDHLTVPAWLALLFSLTNILLGVLGFWVTFYFIKKNKKKAATLQTIWSHAAMMFILIFGWDGSGYQRFFYAGNGDDWYNNIKIPWTNFFTSPVFYTLLGMAIVFIPTYFGLIAYFKKQT